jgi:8-oxo-dGTP pyrophosphatase MutT (NUDIX family)
MATHYASGGVLYHAAMRQILLQQRTDDAPAYPGQWGLFGGEAKPEDDDDTDAVGRQLHPARALLDGAAA